MDKMKAISDMNFEELVAAEKAASTVRKSYEDRLAIARQQTNFDSFYRPMNENEAKQATELKELSVKLGMVNAVRMKILNEMEYKLLKLDSANGEFTAKEN